MTKQKKIIINFCGRDTQNEAVLITRKANVFSLKEGKYSVMQIPIPASLIRVDPSIALVSIVNVYVMNVFVSVAVHHIKY